MASFVPAPAADWIERLADLAVEADAHGIRNVTTLIARWKNGSERYDRQGESMLVVVAGKNVIGVGGIARCPHVGGALRVRRFYVAMSARRQGVARALAERLIAQGFKFTPTLTCNAGASAAAPPFWEAMGFHRVDIPGITHMRLAPPSMAVR